MLRIELYTNAVYYDSPTVVEGNLNDCDPCSSISHLREIDTGIWYVYTMAIDGSKY